MSVEASIPTPPLPGKDPPSSSTSPFTSNPAAPPPASTSPLSMPPPNLASPGLPLSNSRSMRPVLRSNNPTINTTSISTLPLQTSEPAAVAPRPNFNPFFTLISDPTTQSTHHPSRIHYIFCDDDESEVLTAACVRSLQQDLQDESPAASRDLEPSEGNVRESGTSSSSSATFRKGGEKGGKGIKGKAPKREERVVIVDINESGDGIVSTSSLSSSWQIINAEIANAPTFNNDSDGETGAEEGERGLMLKIEGVVVETGEEMGNSGEKRKGKGAGESSVMGEEEMQALLEGFDRKMGILRKIVAVGESWDLARKDKEVVEGDAGRDV